MSDQTSIEIDNAGLILVTPFLTRFFKNLGYLDVMRFADKTTHAKALYLLEYIAQGDETKSRSLALNALLCGWPFNEPLPAQIALSDVEKQLADQIMDALLAHWPMPEKMTVHELRKKFMQRQGKLKTNLHSQLYVFPLPQDELLKDFPWVYKRVQTPWSGIIEVNWDNSR